MAKNGRQAGARPRLSALVMAGEWTAWRLMLLTVLAALLGLFGEGLLSRRHLSLEDGSDR
ncbi:MAG: hypothetical protein L0387_44455 [Acidobacteria bacterium]|nr:hypothetical protein [Acidobacteriota bacterium]MCI0628634.1 hypothetical protein [Acidobacteriota bacterium]MCI0723020.1 hypothetical protein [Acidobacteriota bacterium]